jgi:16S rRNA (cytosine1402-N4)-methyltransferase
MHLSVLLNETIDSLEIREGDTIVDCTLNGGGHSGEMLRKFGDKITVIGLDADQSAIDRAVLKIGKRNNFLPICTNFRDLDKALTGEGISEVSGFMFDLGFSSNQLEESGRGFSFQKDEPLKMTFAVSGAPFDAEEIVNSWAADSIESILTAYGEESFAKRIAKAIVDAREEGRIETTAQLVDIVRGAVPKFYRNKKINPATKTFQALRIAVNDELGALTEGLNKAWNYLEAGRRISVISFHSLEDRIVKLWMREKAKEGLGKLITKKPVVATRDEMLDNPRSRSAKLRIIEKF